MTNYRPLKRFIFHDDVHPVSWYAKRSCHRLVTHPLDGLTPSRRTPEKEIPVITIEDDPVMPQPICRSLTSPLAKYLGSHLYVNLQELDRAFGNTCDLMVVTKQDRHLLEVSKWLFHGVKQFVVKAHAIGSFQMLPASHQMALLQRNVSCIMLLTSVTVMDTSMTSWSFKCALIDGAVGNATISMDILKELDSGSQSLYSHYSSLVTTFHHLWVKDRLILIILSGAILFNSQGCAKLSSLSQLTTIKTRYNIYECLLSRYLNWKFGGPEAESILASLAGAMAKLRIMKSLLEMSTVLMTNEEQKYISELFSKQIQPDIVPIAAKENPARMTLLQ
ncbi:hypothetical protein HDE_11282 [Halotydeus destructor]|nr:hypothetical protein HDE_11282 [Halotydeus destructor]